jgi:hypothetical protein
MKEARPHSHQHRSAFISGPNPRPLFSAWLAVSAASEKAELAEKWVVEEWGRQVFHLPANHVSAGSSVRGLIAGKSNR